MICEECQIEESKFLCIECEQSLCGSCNESLHKGGKRKTHTRPLVCHNCKNQAVRLCVECSLNLCGSCESFHKLHQLTHLGSSKRVGVFWDISSCRPTRSDDIRILAKEIQTKVGNAEFIKAYGDPWGKWKDSLTVHGIESVNKSGIKTYEGLLLDLSISLNTGLTHVLVISSQCQTFTPHLLQLKSNISAVEFWISPTILPLQIQKTIEEEQKREKFSNQDIILSYLKDEAYKGNVILDYKEFISILCLKLKLPPEEIQKSIDNLDRSKLVNLTSKHFDHLVFDFISLKVHSGSLECLTWTLRSLCLDEMLPSEKAIQARMREVFDYKPSTSDWENLLALARGHSHSHSAPDFSLFSRSATLPKFTFKEITDPASKAKTLLIYPTSEYWHALDTNLKFGDDAKLKESVEWKEMIKYLENYFAPKGIRRPKKDEEVKSIPGGRYGCAQFLKVCGPVCLRSCSLGRLSYMVQLAISEDYLRYQRTLLIWTPSTSPAMSKHEIVRRIQAIKSTVISILEQSENGISLAQLPMHLKNSVDFNFNINELGFAKLKDLLATFPEVTIELRDTNHPFAVLSKIHKFIPHTEKIVAVIANLLNKENFGIEEQKLEAQLSQSFGRIDWRAYQVKSLVEFIQTHGKNRFEVIKSNYSQIVFLEKPPSYSYFYNSSLDRSWDYFAERNPSPTYMHQSSLSTESQDWHKVVNISALPAEIMKHEDEPNYFCDAYNESGSTDYSYSLTRDRKGKSKAEHYKIQSEDLSEKIQFYQSDYSWIDCSMFKPPPGF